MAASGLLHQKFYFLVIVNSLTILDLFLKQHAQDDGMESMNEHIAQKNRTMSEGKQRF
jgi:hypothetical protein